MNSHKSNSLPPSSNAPRSTREILKEEFLNLGHKLSSASSPKEAARIILKAADKLLVWDCGYIYIYSPEEDRAYPVLIMDIEDGRKVEFPSVYAPEPLTPITLKVVKHGAQLKFRSKSD